MGLHCSSARSSFAAEAPLKAVPKAVRACKAVAYSSSEAAAPVACSLRRSRNPSFDVGKDPSSLE